MSVRAECIADEKITQIIYTYVYDDDELHGCNSFQQLITNRVPYVFLQADPLRLLAASFEFTS